MKSRISKKEALFLLGLSVWLFATVSPGLKQPLYWDSAYSLGYHAKRIAVNLNLFNYRDKTDLLPAPIYTSFINQESDYPHTFGLAMSYAFLLALFPNNYYSVWHHISLLFSIGLSIVSYMLFKEKLSKFQAGLATTLLVSSPIFLAQTTLVYHEILGALFKYLAIYFLIKDRKKWFLLSSIIAFLIRFENGPILIGTAAIWFGFIKNWQPSLMNLKKSWKQIFALFLIVILWFFIHLKINGWLMISPLFGHEINRQRAVQDLYSFLFIEQGRELISIITLFLAIFNLKNIRENKKTVSLLLLISVPMFVIVWQIGNSLSRYTVSILPFFYFMFAAMLPKKTNLKVKLIITILTATALVYQNSFTYKCYGNMETCLSFIQLISIKKEIALFLEKNVQANETIYSGWDEVRELSDPEYSLGYFCQHCSQAEFKDFLANANDYQAGEYVVTTTNSTNQIKKIKETRPIRLVRTFGRGDIQAQIYQLTP